MNPYGAGANFERRLIRQLESEGWFCLRSAGSHSPVDIVSFKLGETRLWQCQLDSYFAPAKERQVMELARENNFQGWLAWRDEKKKLKMKQIY